MPVFETTDDSSGHVTPEDFYDFVCPESERETGAFVSTSRADQSVHITGRVAERKFYMYTYKTRRCEGFPWNCQCDGFDWHRRTRRSCLLVVF